MVHALQTISGMLTAGGYLVDIHPFSDPPPIAWMDAAGETLLGWLEETDNFVEYFQADLTLLQVIQADLYILEEQGSFEFYTHASSLEALQNHLETTGWEDAVIPKGVWKRAQELREVVPGEAEVVLQETVHIARLRLADHHVGQGGQG